MIDPRLEYASTLSSRHYLEPSVLRDENRTVFGKTWLLAGRADQVREAGQFFTATIGDEPVLVVRGADGVLRAMSNVCRHRAGPVATGEGKRPVLQCGYHGWTYSLDGRSRARRNSRAYRISIAHRARSRSSRSTSGTSSSS